MPIFAPKLLKGLFNDVKSFSSNEEIELKHKGFNRSIYAIGAIKAAIWLIKKKKGFFNMSNVLGIS